MAGQSKIAQDNGAIHSKKRYVPPVIPYERPVKKQLKKDEFLTYKLQSDPENSESPTYELTVPFFGTGTPEELLIFLRDIRKVIIGQNLHTGPTKYALLRRCLTGDALAAFDRAAQKNGEESNENFESSLKDLIRYVFPRKSLATQKRYMRHFLRKKRDIRVREFMTRLIEINEYLAMFPEEFSASQKLPEDEIMDIAEFAVPASWQNIIVLHGFNPVESTTTEFVEFCERIEFSEGPPTEASAAQAKSSNSPKNANSPEKAKFGQKGSNKRKNPENENFCELHQVYGHSTGNCREVLNQVRNMRSNWETRRNFPSKKQKVEQPMHKKPSPNEANVISKNDIASLVKKTIKECLLSDFVNNKKGKDSSEEEDEINNFEELDISSSDDNNNNA